MVESLDGMDGMVDVLQRLPSQIGGQAQVEKKGASLLSGAYHDRSSLPIL